MISRTGEGSVNTLRLSVSEQERISKELEDRAKGAKVDRRRAVRRYRFAHDLGLPMRLRHPGGSEVFIRVGPRDISELGMGFLHGGYLHCGTTCEFALQLKAGETIPIVAKVVRCDHVTGRVHDVGITFTTPVEMSEVKDLLVQDPPAAPAGSKFSAPAIGRY